MKLTKILPLMLPLLLTACVSAPPESAPLPDESRAVTEESAQDTSRESSDTALVGVCGEALDAASFEERPDYALNDLLYYRTDYGYTALFDGKTYSSHDNPEYFDLENLICTQKCEAASGGVIIVNKGDKIGGLTCTDANAEYYINTTRGYTNNPPFGLMSSNVSFEGELEVTGYAECFYGNEGYVQAGEVFFYPDGDSWQGLPLPYADYDRYLTYHIKDDSLLYAPFRISLDYSASDLDIPQGSAAHIRCVIKDLKLKYVNTNFGSYTISTATVVSAERTD